MRPLPIMATRYFLSVIVVISYALNADGSQKGGLSRSTNSLDARKRSDAIFWSVRPAVALHAQHAFLHGENNSGPSLTVRLNQREDQFGACQRDTGTTPGRFPCVQ